MKSSADGGGYDAVGAKKCILADDDSSRSTGMRNESGTKTYLRAVAQFNALRIFILEVDVVADEDGPMNLHTAQFVKKWPQSRRSWKKSSEDAEGAVAGPSYR